MLEPPTSLCLCLPTQCTRLCFRRSLCQRLSWTLPFLNVSETVGCAAERAQCGNCRGSLFWSRWFLTVCTIAINPLSSKAIFPVSSFLHPLFITFSLAVPAGSRYRLVPPRWLRKDCPPCPWEGDRRGWRGPERVPRAEPAPQREQGSGTCERLVPHRCARTAAAHALWALINFLQSWPSFDQCSLWVSLVHAKSLKVKSTKLSALKKRPSWETFTLSRERLRDLKGWQWGQRQSWVLQPKVGMIPPDGPKGLPAC